MKKMLCMTLALVLCLATLAGCSSGKTGGPTDGPEKVEGGVKITDAYTFEDPADLDFDARYVLYYGPDNPVVQQAASDGMRYYYNVLYAKDEKTIASYTIYAFDKADSAKAYTETMANMGTVLEPVAGDETVIYTVAGADVMEMVANSLKDSGTIADTTAESFVNFYIAFAGATLME